MAEQKKQTRCSNCKTKELKGQQKKFCSRKCSQEWRTKHGNPNAGAKEKITLEVRTQLINAFQRGLSKEEACMVAGIGTTTFDRKYERDDQFRVKIERARSFPDRRSKEVVVEAINNGDTVNARWWLERRQPKQFAPRQKQEITGKDGAPLEHAVIYRPEKLPDDYWKPKSTVDKSGQNAAKTP